MDGNSRKDGCYLKDICVFLRVESVAKGCENWDSGYVACDFNDSKYKDQYPAGFPL